MAGDDQLIILGAEDAGAGDRPPRRRLSVALLLPVVLVGAVALVLTPQEERVVDPSDLPPPAEPAPTTSAPPERLVVEGLPAVAFGWDRLVPVGTAWGVTVAEQGEAGWLAVTDGPGGHTAHVSSDAVTWSAVTLTELEGFGLAATVGESLMAVAAQSYTGGPASVVVSDDGGSTWSSIPLPVDGSVVTALHEGDGYLYAVGGLIDEAEGPLSGAATPAVWRLEEDEGWVPLGLGESNIGRLNSVVSGPQGSGVWVLGSSPDGPTVWTVRGDMLERVPISLPEGFGSRAFIDVVHIGTRYMGLIGADGMQTSGRDLLVSADLVDWTVALRADSDLVDIEAPGDGSLLGRRALGGQLWAFTEGREVVVESLLPAPGSPGETLPYMGALAAGRNVSLVAGSSDSGAVLFVRGVVGTLSSQPIDVEGRGWEAAADLAVASADLFEAPMGSFVTDRGVFVAVGRQVVEVEGVDSGEPQLVPSLPSPSAIGLGPDGLWATGEASGATRLYTNGREGVWSSQRIPLETVQAIIGVDGDPVAFGLQDGAFAALRRGPAGGWLDFGADLGDVEAMAAIDNGLLGLKSSGEVVASEDGTSWEVVGEGRVLGLRGTVPFLMEDRTATLLDRWPSLDTVQLPEPDPFWVVRTEDGFWIGYRNRMFVTSGDGWAGIPLDVEHGIDGLALPVAGSPQPQVILVGGESVRLMRWAGDPPMPVPSSGGG